MVKIADIILEITDARFIDLTRNRQLEREMKSLRKKVILVANKSDLVQKRRYESEFPVVWVSARKHLGVRKLRTAIGIAAGGLQKKRASSIEARVRSAEQTASTKLSARWNTLPAEVSAAGNKRVNVAVFGYPNTGKSSIINMLSGRKVARSSISAGYTKGEQIVKISENIYLIDLPGIIPFDEVNQSDLALIAAKSPWQIKNVQAAAERLIAALQKNGRRELMGIDIGNKEPEDVIEELAIEKKKLRKGGIADMDSMSKILLLQWQKGKL